MRAAAIVLTPSMAVKLVKMREPPTACRLQTAAAVGCARARARGHFGLAFVCWLEASFAHVRRLCGANEPIACASKWGQKKLNALARLRARARALAA